MPPTTRIRVLIVDDHPVVRHGLLAAIGRCPDLAAVGAVADLDQALSLCRGDPPDVILLDLGLPGILPERAVAQLRAVQPQKRILLFSTDEAGDDLCRALEAGAAGVVPRTAEPAELVEALRSTHAGDVWLPPGIGQRHQACRGAARLGDDELACLRLLAAGQDRRQIAAELGWSARRIREAIRRIQRKLGAKNETHLLVTALQRGIVSLG
jgi:two-component system NarL family response regulator